ncbi:MAG: peptidyl-prolyl cis-trans isomerase [bacterium]|nr:peptidyl-prolyl cis-trans isomerase [bacterium]
MDKDKGKKGSCPALAGNGGLIRPLLVTIIISSGLSFLFAFALFAAAALPAKLANKILATVDKRKITVEDFVDFYQTRPRIARWSSPNSSAQDSPKEVLDALIGQVLMAEEARRLYPDALQGYRQEVADFEQTLLVNMVGEEQIDKGIRIDEREVERRIPENQKFEVHLRRIVTDTQQKALHLRKQLEQGADFASLAKRFSLAEDAHKGGDIGYMAFDQGIFPKKVVEEIFGSKKGEIIGPASIREGYALFQVIGTRKVSAEALERTKQYIRQQISLEQKKERWDQLLRHLSEEYQPLINEDLWKQIEQAILDARQAKSRTQSTSRNSQTSAAASTLARMSGLEIARVRGRSIRLKEIIPNPSDPAFGGERPWEKDPALLRRILDRKIKIALVADYARQLHYDQLPKVKKNIARLKDDLITRRLVAEKIYKGLIVTSEECQKYYQEHLAEYQVPERVRISQIIVPDEKAATEISRQLARGEQFSELLKKYPPPDSLTPKGLWARGGSGMGREFEDRVFSLRLGEVSKPIKTAKGFHLVKLLERQSEGFAKLSEVEPRIREILLSVKKEKALQDHIAALRRKSRVVVNETLFQEVVKNVL